MVIGGGPGGAATAAFLAMRGHHVVLVEKERHPRFHIGESLLPRTLPMLDELGVHDAVRAIGVHKPGAEFISEDGRHEAVFDFGRALLGGPDHAYQVRRSDFDQILFDRAAALGAEARQDTAAQILALGPEGAQVRTEGPDGEVIAWQTPVLVDASGRSTLVSNMLSEKRPDPHNTSAAIFGHFRGVPRRADARGGNIRIHLTRPGWMWQIPLRDEVTSIGFVAPGDHLRRRDCGIEAFFAAHCARHPHVAAMLDGAERIGPLHATGNFSYRATAASGPSHIKVGDAYGFIDPIFSTGVHLALTSAREAAAAIGDSLARPATRAARLAQYHRDIERRLSFVSWFIYQIHDPVFRGMMVHPRNVLGVEQAMISLLSGDFRPDPRIRTRIALFRLLRYIVAATGRHDAGEANG
ncbi:MAG: NAD(P)/FAD-dependent oxidoreductase, partial [Thermohalobaculum sp.]|nr:NAD(P)/FAD-dependent oxidoreductase [Thermohalobaculum sp.]